MDICIAHSEGGLITRRAIEGMTEEQQQQMRDNYFVCALGSVKPIPKGYGKRVENVYSRQDFASLPFAIPHMVQSGCEAKFVSCQSSWQQKNMGCIDHAALGATYQKALEKTIKDFRRDYSFYDEKNR